MAAGGGHAAAARPAAVSPRGPRAPGPVHALRPRPEGYTHPLVAPLRAEGRGESAPVCCRGPLAPTASELEAPASWDGARGGRRCGLGAGMQSGPAGAWPKHRVGGRGVASGQGAGPEGSGRGLKRRRSTLPHGRAWLQDRGCALTPLSMVCVWHSVPSAAGMLLVMQRLLLLRHHSSLQTSCGPRRPLRLAPLPPPWGR